MANQIEDEGRRQFFLKAFRELGHTLVHVQESRTNGNGVIHDTHEAIVGETPFNEVPVQIILEEKEINPPGPRVAALAEFARRNRKKFVVAALTGTGVTLGMIGTYAAVRYLIDRNPKADITDV